MARLLRLLGAALSLMAGGAMAECKVTKIADLPVSMAGGDPLVDAKINGTTLHFVADSGAFFSLITPSVATQLGLRTASTSFDLTIEGAGGDVTPKVARAERFEIAGSTLHGVDFLVAGNDLGPDVAGLLGQNLFSFADVEYDLANGMMRLWKPSGCGDHVLAYWLAKDQAYGQLNIDVVTAIEPHTVGEVMINDHKLKAMFDTGGGGSFVTSAAARRAGLDMTGPQVVDAGVVRGGIGLKSFESYLVPVKDFNIGGEEIQNTHLTVGKIELSDFDMWIGTDFFLSHRIYVSNSQHRMYFTYNGGPVFDMSAGLKARPAQAGRKSEDTASSASGLDAAALARRGNASAARGDYAAALADLTRARAAEPANADFALDRSRLYGAQGQADLALADADDAVRLRPDDVPSRLLLAALRLGKSDKARAVVDLDAAAAVAPKPSNAHIELADLYMAADALPAAIGQYDLWLQSHPEDVSRASALNGRCWSRALLGLDLAKALADCDAALRSNGKMAQALDSRGLVHLRLGQYDKALADYDAALALEPKIAWSLYGRGIAKQHLGRTADAKLDLAAAVALAPGLPAIAKGYGVSP